MARIKFLHRGPLQLKRQLFFTFHYDWQYLRDLFYNPGTRSEMWRNRSLYHTEHTDILESNRVTNDCDGKVEACLTPQPFRQPFFPPFLSSTLQPSFCLDLSHISNDDIQHIPPYTVAMALILPLNLLRNKKYCRRRGNSTNRPRRIRPIRNPKLHPF